MNKDFRTFLIKNLMASIIIGVIGGILFYTIFNRYYHAFFPYMLVFAFLVNITLFYITTRYNLSGNKILVAVIRSFIVRFLSYLGMAVTFLLIERHSSYRITFVLLLLCLYIVFSSIEIHSIIKFLKGNQR